MFKLPIIWRGGLPPLKGVTSPTWGPRLRVNRPFVVDLLMLWFTLNLVMVYGTVQWCGERKIKINYEEMKINQEQKLSATSILLLPR